MFYSPYVECRQCMKVVHDPDHKLTKVAEKCPLCNQSGVIRRGWPSLFGELWMEVLWKHEIREPEDRYFRVLMLCACAERMLRDLLKDILFHQGAKEEHAEIILEVRDTRGPRLELFKSLTGVAFSNACITAGQNGFSPAWDRLYKTRNTVVHGVPPTTGLKVEPKDPDMDLVRAKMLDVFAWMHNTYAS